MTQSPQVDKRIGYNLLKYGRECVETKRWTRAHQLFTHVCAIRPDAAASKYHLAAVCMRLKLVTDAVNHINQAYRIAPNIILYAQLKALYNNYNKQQPCIWILLRVLCDIEGVRFGGDNNLTTKYLYLFTEQLLIQSIKRYRLKI
eukprot:88944_1